MAVLVVTEASKGHRWQLLCLLSSSLGYLQIKPQEVWRMGRYKCCGIGLCYTQSRASLSVVTGASEGIGRGYALEVSKKIMVMPII